MVQHFHRLPIIVPFLGWQFPQSSAMLSPNNWQRSFNTEENHVGIISGIAASPDCWLDAFRNLNVDSTSAADACSWMTSKYQKIMALELARCHVRDLGRSLFDESSNAYNMETCSQVSYQDHLGECLIHLTPSAESAYTHFLTYINQLCIRLSQEVLMDHFYDTSVNLAKVASETECQLNEILKQQEAIRVIWSEREMQIEIFHDRLQEDYYQERIRWTQENSLFISQWQRQQDEWLLQQQRLQQRQSDEMIKQQEELRRQKEQLTLLSETVVRTHQSIQPWSLNLESLYQHVQNVYRLLQMVLRLARNILFLWVFTYAPCLRWLRKVVLVVIVLGGLMELLLVWNLRRDIDDFENIYSGCRSAFDLLAVGLYVAGVLFSPCIRPFQGDNMVLDNTKQSVNTSFIDERKGPEENFPTKSIGHRSDGSLPVVPSLKEEQHRQDTFVPTCASVVTPNSLQVALVPQLFSSEQYWTTMGQNQTLSPLLRSKREMDVFYDTFSLGAVAPSRPAMHDQSDTTLKLRASSCHDSESHQAFVESIRTSHKREGDCLQKEQPIEEMKSRKRARLIECDTVKGMEEETFDELTVNA